jgi:proline iminopeptidase
MKKPIPLFLYLIIISILCCSNPAGNISLSANADDLFWVSHDNADMPVWVKGNTASKTIILIIHGGPGTTSEWFDGKPTLALKNKYAVAFWDQRGSGASEGNTGAGDMSLDLFVNDMAAVTSVIKYRYGSDMKIFLYTHSFGGLLGAAFLADSVRRSYVCGWIDIDGAHSYPLCNKLSRQMMIDTGTAQIAIGRNTGDWTTIVNYCANHDANVSLDISLQTEAYAKEAENLMGVSDNDGVDWFSPASVLEVASNLLRMYYTGGGRAFLESLEPLDYTKNLDNVNIPALLIWGRHDFVVPSGVGDTALAHLASADKRMVFMEHSGHAPMRTEPDSVNKEIIDFIERNSR